MTPTSCASVEAGTVLADLVRGLGPRGDVVELTENRRSVAAIQELARAVRSGDPDEVLRFSKPVILRSASPRPTSRPLGHMTGL